MKQFFAGRRARVRLVSFLAAGGAVLAGLALQGQLQARQARQALAQHYQYAFSELTAAAAQLDSALQKELYATSPSLRAALWAQAFRSALSAQTALGNLPYGNVELAQTAAFLAKTGDYAISLARDAGEELSQTEWDTLSDLSGRAERLSLSLQEIQGDLYAGTLEPEDLYAAQDQLSRTDGGGAGEASGTTYQDIEAQFSELPTLIYDGPFSDHLSGRAALALEGLEEVSREKAQAAAARFFSLSPALFSPASEGNGALPTYGFSAVVDGGEVWVEVTRTGGRVLSVLNSRAVGPARLSQEEGVALAAQQLEALGYPGMAETYFMEQEGRLTVNFASVQDGAVCYPDLIKVTVALDTGSIVGFEARNYLMSHTLRDLPAPAVTREQAQRQVGGGLTIQNSRLAVIPTAGAYEVLCYEFQCETAAGEHCLIYVDAQTGEEEQILLLLEDESGTLVR